MNSRSYVVSVLVLSLLTLGCVLLSYGAVKKPAFTPVIAKPEPLQTKGIPRLEDHLNAIAQTVAEPYPSR